MGHSPSTSLNQMSYLSVNPDEALNEMKIILKARREADGVSSHKPGQSKNTTHTSKLPALKR